MRKLLQSPSERAREAWLAGVRSSMPNSHCAANQSYWAPAVDCAPREELREIQLRKLRLALAYVYHCIPFYRRKFDRLGLEPGDIKRLDDLVKIPVTTRQEMADDLEENLPWGSYTAVSDRVWRERGWQLFTTSGTRGKPRVFRYTEFDRELWAWKNARAMWAMGFRPDRDSAMLAFGYGPHVWLWGVHYAFNLMKIPIVTGGGLDSRTRARFIDDYKPTILCCTPTYALYLAEVMREANLDPARSSVKFLFCAGEPGFGIPATRAMLEQTWQAELHEFYGCTEASPAAGGYTCREAAANKGSAMTHLMEDAQIWEIVDSSTLAPAREHELGLSVVTDLSSEASPQIRFLVGDVGRLTIDPCPCGRTHAQAPGGFVGRVDDMLNVRGITVFPSSIEDAIRRTRGVGAEFQISVSTRRNLDVLTIRVEPDAALDAATYSDLRYTIESEIIARCELRPEVVVVPRGSLPRMEFKAKRVQDLRAALPAE